MDFWVLIIMGIVQGVGEFLPISSSGHLVLMSMLFDVDDSLFVSIIFHLATLLSCVVVFKKEIFSLLKKPFSSDGLNLILATLPTCIIVLLLMPIVDLSFSGQWLSVCFLLCGIMLFVTEIILRKKQNKFSVESNIDGKSALVMGICQGLAVFPGISRSGATIMGGLLCGENKTKVAHFSFLMSLPIILISLVLELFKISNSGVVLDIDWLGLVFGFIIAFFIGIFAIKLMIKTTEKLNFKWFGIYLIVLSILMFIFI